MLITSASDGPSTDRIGNWIGCAARLGILEKRKISLPAGNQTPDHPATIEIGLYQLHDNRKHFSYQHKQHVIRKILQSEVEELMASVVPLNL
jgi:hypothetical protein